METMETGRFVVKVQRDKRETYGRNNAKLVVFKGMTNVLEGTKEERETKMRIYCFERNI